MMQKNKNRPGYKETKVGWIPDEWEATTVGDIVDKKIIDKPLDGNHGNIHPVAKDFVNEGIPFVMAKDVQNGVVKIENCICITREQADSLQKGFSKEGDILLTHKATVGNTAIVENISTDYIMLTPQVTYYRVLNKQQINNRFLRHYFDGSPFQKILSVLAGGGTRSYIGITAQRNLPINLPQLPEQKAIAGVLECWDAGIQTLEKKIEKKQAIKKGLMQRLLSGKTRLPGFSDDWKTVKLREVTKIFDGTHMTPKYVKEGIPFYSVEQITSDDFEKTKFISSDVFEKENKRVKIEFGDILMTRIGDIGTSKYVNWNANASFYVSIVLLKQRVGVNFEFLNHQIGSHEFQRELWKKTIHVAYPKKINLGELNECKITLPPLEEQQAIAEVLSAADREIEVLERKLTTWREQKKFLLNNLVTGSLRLPEFRIKNGE